MVLQSEQRTPAQPLGPTKILNHRGSSCVNDEIRTSRCVAADYVIVYPVMLHIRYYYGVPVRRDDTEFPGTHACEKVAVAQLEFIIASTGAAGERK